MSAFPIKKILVALNSVGVLFGDLSYQMSHQIISN